MPSLSLIVYTILTYLFLTPSGLYSKGSSLLPSVAYPIKLSIVTELSGSIHCSVPFTLYSVGCDPSGDSTVIYGSFESANGYIPALAFDNTLLAPKFLFIVTGISTINFLP